MKPIRMLTLRTASREVGRTRQTLMRWIRDGMPTARDERGRHIVREDILRDTLRSKMKSNPAHQYRLRRHAAEDAEKEVEDPA